jgi:hypothetical protein
MARGRPGGVPLLALWRARYFELRGIEMGRWGLWEAQLFIHRPLPRFAVASSRSLLALSFSPRGGGRPISIFANVRVIARGQGDQHERDSVQVRPALGLNDLGQGGQHAASGVRAARGTAMRCHVPLRGSPGALAPRTAETNSTWVDCRVGTASRAAAASPWSSTALWGAPRARPGRPLPDPRSRLPHR